MENEHPRGAWEKGRISLTRVFVPMGRCSKEVAKTLLTELALELALFGWRRASQRCNGVGGSPSPEQQKRGSRWETI